MMNKFFEAMKTAEEYIKNFSNEQVEKDIKADLKFLYKNDPSITKLEHVDCITSAFAVACYRIAHAVEDDFLARSIMEYAKMLTGVDIHPRCKIGVPFCIDHGVGTVIGETSVIGKNCMLYHGVTLGAKHLKERDQVGKDRHPKLGDRVIIYSNTTILGNIHIPDGMLIGANKFIRKQEELTL